MTSPMKFCQSCGMPLSQDPLGGGRNADGTRSDHFCSFCYLDGAFVDPDMTAQDMQTLCSGKLRDHGTLALLAWLKTRHIPHLERWRDAA
ncbi:zinc ribbon domain-containing protein [Celeribacter ethanolicus]|nr:zinc ribbon domain-containing protein [Celeribacter ethanolicus]